MRAHARSAILRASLLALATIPVITCTADTPESTGAAEQAAINPPLPSLTLILNARNTLTIGAFTQVNGDVAASGNNGSLLFDVSSSQSFFGNALANTVKVQVGASAGHVFGNDITVDGSAAQQSLGLDPAALPAVPAATASSPGTTNVSVATNQAKQLCPGQYGAISLAAGATLNLNGGVYQLSRLNLAEGAKLEPSEPVVILVSGNMITSTGAIVRPSAQSIGPMSAADIRIEVSGSITLGEGSQVRAHLLAPNGKLTTNKSVSLIGAGWAKNITIGAQNFLSSDGVLNAQTPSVPPPCNDNNACTTDACVTSGTIAFCRNTPTPSGTSCDDGSICNGVARCDGAGSCLAGAPPEAGTSCSDGNACNGDETCDGFSSCLSGSPPPLSDGNACTADACDPSTGVSHVPVPDGTTCSGVGVCEGGTCSVAGIVFSEHFIQFDDAFAQCNSWNDFLNNRLVDGSYGSVSMSGTFDPAGVTCSNPDAATQICQALHHNSFASVFCDGHQWSVGQCGGAEVSVDVNVCFCTSPGRTVRPCIGFGEWGGVNTDTCFGPSQDMTVVCQ